MSVIDASAVVEFVICSDIGLRVADLLGQEQGGDAPEVMVSEVLSTCRRLEGVGPISDVMIEQIVQELEWLPIRRHAHGPLVQDAWAMRHNLTAADALYVSLARRLGTGLITLDARLAGAPNLGIPVTVVT